MTPQTRKTSDARLARIEGQIRGLRRMVAEDQYCIDIVRQVQAVKAALSGLESVVLADHLDTCVEAALKSDSLDDRRDKVEELVAVLSGKKK